MAPLLLAVFDLDYTIWEPEMYQLSGHPKLVHLDSSEVRVPRRKNRGKHLKRSVSMEEGKIVVDDYGTPITVFDGASFALSEIIRMNKENEKHKIQVAIASKTDEPKWAHFCMKNLAVIHDDNKTSLYQMIPNKNLIEINAYANKTVHLTNLKNKTKIPFDSMVFFDNEYHNIRTVQKLGVKCVYTPDGMTRDAWKEALEKFD